MAIEKRERKTSGRRKEYSYRVKWRYQGTGAQQSVTLDNQGDAERLEEALRKSGWAYLKADPEIQTLSLIGKSEPAKASRNSARSRMTVADVVEQFINRPGLSAGSRRIYRQTLDRLGSFGEISLADVTTDDVDAWFTEQSAELSSNTMVVVRIVLNGAFTRNERPELLKNIAKVEGKREVKPIYLTPLQLDILVEAAREEKGRNYAAMVRLSGTYGLRWGEVMGLQVRHLHLEGDRPWVEISQAVPNSALLRDGFKPGPVKTVKSERVVPITVAMAKELAEVVDGRGQSAVVFRPKAGNGAFWCHRTFIYGWKKLAERTPEIPDELRFHDMRHTAAKNMLERGVPISYVSDILGHSSVNITAGIYGRFDRGAQDLVRGLMD